MTCNRDARRRSRVGHRHAFTRRGMARRMFLGRFIQSEAPSTGGAGRRVIDKSPSRSTDNPGDLSMDTPTARPDGPGLRDDLSIDTPTARPDGPGLRDDLSIDTPTARPDGPGLRKGKNLLRAAHGPPCRMRWWVGRATPYRLLYPPHRLQELPVVGRPAPTNRTIRGRRIIPRRTCRFFNFHLSAFSFARWVYAVATHSPPVLLTGPRPLPPTSKFEP
jgi:hypothetical protein